MSSTRATSNQIKWRQYTEREREQREKNEMSKEFGDYNEVEVEVEVKTSRRSTRSSTKTVETQLTKKSTKKVTIAITKPAHSSQLFENVQLVRTRAQKRLADAVDAMVQLQDTLAPVAPVAQKAGRRSEYWVKRDDKRRQSARLLKIQQQQPH